MYGPFTKASVSATQQLLLDCLIHHKGKLKVIKLIFIHATFVYGTQGACDIWERLSILKEPQEIVSTLFFVDSRHYCFL